MAQQLHTYVEFIRPDPARRDRNGVSTTRKVDSRDLARLDIPAGTTVFYFYDSPEDDPRRAAKDQRNLSKLHVVARRLATRRDVKEMLLPRAAGEEPPNIIWDPRITANRLFAVTREDTIEPLTRHHVAIDIDKKQLWPKPQDPKRKTRLSRDFDTALKKDLLISKPIRLRPKPARPQPPHAPGP
ncbi:MAG: hypothetical protein GC185_12490 [Alphaproteobacteria bacterium]|nr:hypothetical protein [Alphaproteobacteria bacterium]